VRPRQRRRAMMIWVKARRHARHRLRLSILQIIRVIPGIPPDAVSRRHPGGCPDALPVAPERHPHRTRSEAVRLLLVDLISAASGSRIVKADAFTVGHHNGPSSIAMATGYERSLSDRVFRHPFQQAPEKTQRRDTDPSQAAHSRAAITSRQVPAMPSRPRCSQAAPS
jgi:hypothetical protein